LIKAKGQTFEKPLDQCLVEVEILGDLRHTSARCELRQELGDREACPLQDRHSAPLQCIDFYAISEQRNRVPYSRRKLLGERAICGSHCGFSSAGDQTILLHLFSMINSFFAANARAIRTA